MAHHVYFVGHPCLRASMVAPGEFKIEARGDWQSSDWTEVEEISVTLDNYQSTAWPAPKGMTLDEAERRVLGGSYALYEEPK